MDEFKEVLKKHLDKCVKDRDFETAKSIIELMKCLESGPTYVPIPYYPTYPSQPMYPWWTYGTTSEDSDTFTNVDLNGDNITLLS